MAGSQKLNGNAASGLPEMCQLRFSGAVDTEGHNGLSHEQNMRKLRQLVEALFQEAKLRKEEIKGQ